MFIKNPEKKSTYIGFYAYILFLTLLLMIINRIVGRLPWLQPENITLTFIALITCIAAWHAKHNKPMKQFKIIAATYFIYGFIALLYHRNTIIWLYTILGVFSITAAMQFQTLKTTPKTIEDKIKKELHLNFVKNKKLNFPKGLRWIGGLTTIFFPFYTVQNKKWKKKNRGTEVIIHENMHLHLIMNHWLGIFLLGIVGIPILAGLVFTNTILKGITIMITIALLVTLHEWETHVATQKFAMKHYKLKTSPFPLKRALTYWLIYTTWFCVISLLFYGIGLLF